MTRFELKCEAHDLIDEIVALGRRREGIYSYLGKRLYKARDEMHFAQINDEETLRYAIGQLKILRNLVMKDRKRAAQKKAAALIVSGAFEPQPRIGFWERLWNAVIKFFHGIQH